MKNESKHDVGRDITVYPDIGIFDTDKCSNI